MHVQAQLQTILASYCLEHKERAYVQPNQFRVWMQRVFPADKQPKSKNTVFCSVLAKRIQLELKTTRMAFSNLAPSKQETSLGIAYRHLEIVPFPERLRIPPADRLDPSPEDIEGYDACLFLKENANPALETLNWTRDMLKGWLEESDFAVKKPALQKKVPPFPPLSFIHKPLVFTKTIVCLSFTGSFLSQSELHAFNVFVQCVPSVLGKPMSPCARFLSTSLRKTPSPILCGFHAGGLRCCTCWTMIKVQASVGMR